MLCRNDEGMQFLQQGEEAEVLGWWKILDGETVTLGILWCSKNIIRSAVKEPVE